MIGKEFSHYKIVEKLGEGGMGVVYKAQDTKLDRFVALKFLPSHIDAAEEEKTRFMNEARATSALDHANICTIYEINETDDGRMFIAMGYYEGETLKQKLKDGALEEDEAVDIALQIAIGLARAHEAGVTHRDVKPANIIVTNRGEVKILDFGLAKLAGQARVTRVGTTLGTAAYMSPEQAKGEDVDHRTDIWALGVILYEMLTGELPFKGEYEAAVAYSILNEEPESMTALRPEVYEGLERLVKKALAKNPTGRFQKMEELAKELKSRGVGVAAPEMGKPAAREGIEKKRWLLKFGVPVGIGVAVAIGFLLLKPLVFKGGIGDSPKPIAVMRFENKTVNESLDYLGDVIANLLITNLEQSQYLRVTTRERMIDLLKQMGKADVEQIDRELGFELCQRDGIDAIIFGSFSQLEESFITTVKVWEVASRKELQTVTSNGPGITSILETQIDELSMQISRGLGLSDSKVGAISLRIADITTTSMDAYREFLKGREKYEGLYWNDARQSVEAAVSIDSTFAVAHLYLAWTYEQLGNIGDRDEAFERAKIYSNKASDKEKLYIEAAYADGMERDPEKGFEIRQQIVKKYPKEKRVHWDLAYYYIGKALYYEAIEEYNKALELDPNYGFVLNDLAYTYVDLGEYDKAIPYFHKYAAVSPGDANPFDSMGETYFVMGRFDEAIAKYEEALAIKSDFEYASWSIAYIYALKEDYPAAMEWIARFIAQAPSSVYRVQGYAWKGLYCFLQGNLNDAFTELKRAADLAKTAGDERWRYLVDWMRGWMYYERGELELSRRYCMPWFDFAVAFYSDLVPRYTADRQLCLGLIHIKQGQMDEARKNLLEMKNLLPEIDAETRERISFCYDLLEGEILVAEGSYESAIAIHKRTSQLGGKPYMTPFWMLFRNIPFMKDVWARAYKQNGDSDRAIAEYERLLTFDEERKERTLINPIYHYRLGMLYEEKGLTQKAVAEYGRFLKMWENADRDLPELMDVNQRLRRLAGGSTSG
ncbi:MAG: protein kinase [bacterium]